MNDQKPCLGLHFTETNKVQEMLDLSRSHAGRAVGLFVALGVMPGVSWHDAAIAAASVSIYAFWVRCEANAEPGETGADVLARRSADWAKEVTQVAAAIAAFPPLAKTIERHPKVKGAIARFLPVTEEAIEPPAHVEAVLPAFLPSVKSAIAS